MMAVDVRLLHAPGCHSAGASTQEKNGEEPENGDVVVTSLRGRFVQTNRLQGTQIHGQK